MDAETRKLVMEIMDKNPGALRVLHELMWFSNWSKYLLYLKKVQLKGAELWVLYKDVHGRDPYALAHDLDERLRKEEQRKNKLFGDVAVGY